MESVTQAVCDLALRFGESAYGEESIMVGYSLICLLWLLMILNPVASFWDCIAYCRCRWKWMPTVLLLMIVYFISLWFIVISLLFIFWGSFVIMMVPLQLSCGSFWNVHAIRSQSHWVWIRRCPVWIARALPQGEHFFDETCFVMYIWCRLLVLDPCGSSSTCTQSFEASHGRKTNCF